MSMKIALIQMHSTKGEIKENSEIMKRFFEKLSQEGVDIMVFPEMNLTGYFDDANYKKKALALTDIEVLEIVQLTNDTNITIIFGIAEKANDKVYISQIIAESGKIMGIYRKHNIIDNEAQIFTAGSDEPVFTKENIKYGISICADIDLPDLYLQYAQNSCDIVFECASPNLYGDRETRNWEKGYQWWRNNCIEKLSQYAKANNIQIGVATQSGGNIGDDFPGGGYLFSQNGDLISETENHTQEVLIVNL